MNQPPPVKPTPEQTAYLAAFVKQAVPLDAPGVIYWPDTGAFYVVGKHPLMVKPTVIKVPFAMWAAAFGGLLTMAIVPTLNGLRPGLVPDATGDGHEPGDMDGTGDGPLNDGPKLVEG
jgi:hypothetical protein